MNVLYDDLLGGIETELRLRQVIFKSAGLPEDYRKSLL